MRRSDCNVEPPSLRCMMCSSCGVVLVLPRLWSRGPLPKIPRTALAQGRGRLPCIGAKSQTITAVSLGTSHSAGKTESVCGNPAAIFNSDFFVLPLCLSLSLSLSLTHTRANHRPVSRGLHRGRSGLQCGQTERSRCHSRLERPRQLLRGILGVEERNVCREDPATSYLGWGDRAQYILQVLQS